MSKTGTGQTDNMAVMKYYRQIDMTTSTGFSVACYANGGIPGVVTRGDNSVMNTTGEQRLV